MITAAGGAGGATSASACSSALVVAGGANGGVGGTSGADDGATAQGGTAGTLSYNATTIAGIPTTKTNINNGLGEKTGQSATAGTDGFVIIVAS